MMSSEITSAARIKARIEGAKAARAGLKLDSNPYPETSDLHFEWLAAWSDTRLKMMRPEDRAS